MEGSIVRMLRVLIMFFFSFLRFSLLVPSQLRFLFFSFFLFLVVVPCSSCGDDLLLLSTHTDTWYYMQIQDQSFCVNTVAKLVLGSSQPGKEILAEKEKRKGGPVRYANAWGMCWKQKVVGQRIVEYLNFLESDKCVWSRAILEAFSISPLFCLSFCGRGRGLSIRGFYLPSWQSGSFVDGQRIDPLQCFGFQRQNQKDRSLKLDTGRFTLWKA